jgi:membrane-associated protein
MNIIDFILHIDKHLEHLIAQYDTLTYLILCLIIFCETGLVLTPLLPGDSLLFAAGMITASTGVLNIWILIVLLIAAAFAGDNVNYLVGKFIGEKLFEVKLFRKILKRKYLDQTHAFYEKHGGKTIIMARFVPIVRTFAPFAAGIGHMSYTRYVLFCIAGAMLWVPLLSLAGYYFGNIPLVKKNFEIVIFSIIFISLLPMIIAYFKSKFAKT